MSASSQLADTGEHNMITTAEIDGKAREYGLGSSNVEKDYVYGWVLKAIFSGSPLANHLILKGGNGLRKAYLPNTRFSKDLDFSAAEHIDKPFLKEELNRICMRIEAETAIGFDTERTLVRDKDLPIPGVEAIEARLYFRGFFGEENIVLKAQLDVTEYDKIYLPVQNRQLLHPYSDASACSATIRCQKIEEILASKLNTLLQRRRAGDLFDLLYSIIFSQDYPVVRGEVIRTFLRKSIFEPQPLEAKAQLLSIPLVEFRDLWHAIIAPIRSFFGFEYVTAQFSGLIENLFSLILQPRPVSTPAVRPGLRMGRGLPRLGGGFPTSIGSTYLSGGTRGRSQTLVEVQYEDKPRRVEPYKLEYRTRKSDKRGLEYFWAYDPVGAGRSGQSGIKQFICDKIEAVRPTGIPFQPRFQIDL